MSQAQPAPTPTAEATLYQFELCPYCNKVKAGLEVKGVPYRKVEVNPMNKKELPANLPEGAPRKVPVLTLGGELMFDSTDILRRIDALFPDTHPFDPADPAAKALSDQVENWVDDEFTFALPTVIYGTWGEARRAAQVTAATSNFGFFQNISVRAGGSLIMHQISKRILKKRNRTDAHAWISDCMDTFEGWLGDKPFVAGQAISLGDVAMHGAMSCVTEFPIYSKMMQRPKVKAWFDRVQTLRTQNAAA